MEDLRLSLSLGNSASFANHRRHWADLAASSMSIADTTKSSLKKGIDVNRAPTTERDMEEDDDEEEEEEAWISSPKSTVSSASAGKRGMREESENDRTCSGGGPTTTTSDDEDGGDGSRKKLRLSKDQSAILEESFKEHNTLNPKQKLSLAKQLNLRPRQVEVWFQNRRARTKLKQTEVDYEFLKRCCENLTEENRRLQKEVQELRALKMSPQFYMQMTPPTTLTLCPSCERVAVSSSTSSSTTTFAASSKPPQPGTPHHSPWSGSGNGSSKINRQFSQQQQQQSHPFFQNRPLIPVGGMPVLPWAPMPTCQRL